MSAADRKSGLKEKLPRSPTEPLQGRRNLSPTRPTHFFPPYATRSIHSLSLLLPLYPQLIRICTKVMSDFTLYRVVQIFFIFRKMPGVFRGHSFVRSVLWKQICFSPRIKRVTILILVISTVLNIWPCSWPFPECSGFYPLLRASVNNEIPRGLTSFLSFSELYGAQ